MRIEDRNTREKIRQMRNDINFAYDKLRYEKQILSAETVKIRAEGADEQQHTLIWLLSYHNNEIGKLLEPGTMKNYYTTERYVREFLEQKKKRKDIYLPQIDHKFILDLGLYLRLRKPDKGQRACSNNTVMKHMERLKKIMGIALKNRWVVNDPFLQFERTMVKKDRECLDVEEIERLRNTELNENGHNIVRDMFLFSCYTGLAYVELCCFSRMHIIRDGDGEYWIEMTRKKTFNTTERKFHVLLLPEAIELIDKYEDHPASVQKKTIFPFHSNQNTNRYLKVIAKKADISKKVTFHLARHTFATTITLENGVPMESVSHMLGHASIRTTQIYSKVRKKKVANDMKGLREKLHPEVIL